MVVGDWKSSARWPRPPLVGGRGKEGNGWRSARRSPFALVRWRRAEHLHLHLHPTDRVRRGDEADRSSTPRAHQGDAHTAAQVTLRRTVRAATGARWVGRIGRTTRDERAAGGGQNFTRSIVSNGCLDTGDPVRICLNQNRSTSPQQNVLKCNFHSFHRFGRTLLHAKKLPFSIFLVCWFAFSLSRFSLSARCHSTRRDSTSQTLFHPHSTLSPCSRCCPWQAPSHPPAQMVRHTHTHTHRGSRQSSFTRVSQPGQPRHE